MAEALFADALKGPVCGCLNRLRADLREQNGIPGVERSSGAALVYIRRSNPEGPMPPIVAATFCPFCGEGYQ